MQRKLLEPRLADPEAQVQAAAARALHEAGVPGMIEHLVLASHRAPSESAREAYEATLSALRLTEDARETILAKAGVAARDAR